MAHAQEWPQNRYTVWNIKTVWAKKGYLVKNSQGRLFHCTKCHGIKGTYIKLLQKPAENTEIPEEVPF